MCRYFYFFFSVENPIATVQIIGFKVNGIPIFHSVVSIVSVHISLLFQVGASAEKIHAHTHTTGYGTAKRLNDFTFFFI